MGLTALLASCGAATDARPAGHASATEHAPRHAAGVAVDPAPRLPGAAVESATDRGVAVLRSPRDARAARALTIRFFRAAVEESEPLMSELIDERCTMSVDLAGNRIPCRAFWPVRFERLDYSALTGKVVFRERDVETFQDPQALAQAGRVLPVQASPEDVVVRVPVAASRAGKERLFGDEIWFVLKPGKNGYTISEMMEEFSLP